MKILKIVQLALVIMLGLNACQPTTSDGNKTANTQIKEENSSAIPEPVKSPEPPKNVPKTHEPQIVLPPPIIPKSERAITLKELPAEARPLLEQIKTGSAPPHSKKDGSEFKNHHKRLPKKEPGYYKEYIVPNAQVHLQHTRRIIVGAGGELYYTEDGYKTFRPISLK